MYALETITAASSICLLTVQGKLFIRRLTNEKSSSTGNISFKMPWCGFGGGESIKYCAFVVQEKAACGDGSWLQRLLGKICYFGAFKDLDQIEVLGQKKRYDSFDMIASKNQWEETFLKSGRFYKPPLCFSPLVASAGFMKWEFPFRKGTLWLLASIELVYLSNNSFILIHIFNSITHQHISIW